MAELATLARPYANAAFDLARNADRLDEWSGMLSLLTAAAATPAIRALIQSPSTTREAKGHKLVDVLRDDLGDAGRKFVLVVALNGRLALLPEISAQFEVLKAQAERTLDVEISSAIELSDDQLERMTAVLQGRFDQEINITTKIDGTLLGGAVIRAGDTVIDGSVRGKLNKLSESLQRV